VGEFLKNSIEAVAGSACPCHQTKSDDQPNQFVKANAYVQAKELIKIEFIFLFKLL